MAKFLIRYAKFAGTSLIGSMVDTLVLWLMSDLVFTKGYWGEYIISPMISFQCAVAVNYTISYFYVWKDRTRKRPDASVRRFFRLYAAYNLSNSMVFLFRLGVLLLIERFSGWDVVFCNLTAMCFSGIINFTINNLLIFKKKKTCI
ncbi:MAG: GtrA family protein [Bacteroidales bacterium]|nr:GtrA family protein [Bacteroidales bacterium]